MDGEFLIEQLILFRGSNSISEHLTCIIYILEFIINYNNNLLKGSLVHESMQSFLSDYINPVLHKLQSKS